MVERTVSLSRNNNGRKKHYRLLGLALIIALLWQFLPGFSPLADREMVVSLPEPIAATLPAVAPAQLAFSLPDFGPSLVQATGGLTITKIADPSHPQTVDQGGTIVYTLTVTNDTGLDLDQIQVNDTVPANVTCSTIVGTSGYFNSPSCLSLTDNTIVWFGDTTVLGDAQSVSFVYTVQVDAPLPYPTIISNDNYGVSGVPVGGGTALTDPGTGPITVTVNSPNWEIAKTAQPNTTVSVGEYITYTITVTNTGSLPTSGSYTIVDEVPNSTIFIDSPATNPNGATVSGSTLTWALAGPILAQNQSTQVQFSVQVNGPLADGALITNQTYSVSGGGAVGPIAGLPVAVEAATSTDIAISKADSAAGQPVRAGQLLTYTLVYTNWSGDAIGGVRITDTLPASVTLSSVDTGSATQVSASPLVFSRPSMAFGESDRITVVVQLDTTPWPAAGADFSNAVTAGMTGVSEPYTANNNASVTTTGRPDEATALILTAPAQAFAGQNTPITATLTDQYGNPVFDGTPVTFAIQAPGLVGSGTVNTSNGQAVEMIDASLPATVVVTATHGGLSQSATVEFILPALRKLVEPSTVSAGQPVTYTIAYQNDLGTPLTNLLITDTLPAEVMTYTIDSGPMTVLDNIGPELVFSQASLGAGEIVTVTIVALFQYSPWPAAGATVVNNVVASSDTNPVSESNSASVLAHAGPPANIVLQVAPSSVPVGNSAVATASVTDQYGNPIFDGTLVNFATSLSGSTITPSSSSQNGAATATITSSVVGTTTITATTGDVLDTTSLTFTASSQAIYLPLILK